MNNLLLISGDIQSFISFNASKHTLDPLLFIIVWIMKCLEMTYIHDIKHIYINYICATCV